MKKLFCARFIALLLALLCVLSGCIDRFDVNNQNGGGETPAPDQQVPDQNFDLSTLPAYSGVPYVALDGNVPAFTADQYTTASYEFYSELDSLGRCG
jgi:DNA-entry nuclease